MKIILWRLRLTKISGSKKMRLVVIFLCSSLLRCWSQGTLQITFEGPSAQPPGSDYFVQQYSESSMSFRPIGAAGPGNGFERVGSGYFNGPQNGTAYLAAGAGESLAFNFTNDNPFNLESVDLAEYSLAEPDAATVHFVGYHPDGSMVTTDFTTDGAIDGTGPQADFQTFHFGSEFSNLTRVEIPTFGWSLDNLVVSVPEPTTNALLFIGVLVFGALKLRRQQR